jgi:hypothetical protein
MTESEVRRIVLDTMQRALAGTFDQDWKPRPDGATDTVYAFNAMQFLDNVNGQAAPLETADLPTIADRLLAISQELDDIKRAIKSSAEYEGELAWVGHYASVDLACGIAYISGSVARIRNAEINAKADK